mgnify:FL=1
MVRVRVRGRVRLTVCARVRPRLLRVTQLRIQKCTCVQRPDAAAAWPPVLNALLKGVWQLHLCRGMSAYEGHVIYQSH